MPLRVSLCTQKQWRSLQRLYETGQLTGVTMGPRCTWNEVCHYPHSHEPVFQHNPGQQEDKGFVTTEQGGDIRGRQLLQSQ